MTCNHPGFSKGQRLQNPTHPRPDYTEPALADEAEVWMQESSSSSAAGRKGLPWKSGSRERQPFLKVWCFQTFGRCCCQPPTSKSWEVSKLGLPQTCRKRRVCGRRAPTTTTVWVSPVKKVKRRASRFGSVALTAVVSLDAVMAFWISGGKKDGQKSSPL